MQPGLISVIIPTYNRAHMLADAIRSAQMQDYPWTQIIVVDDGSTDGTAQLMSTFPEVEYHFQANGGQAAARNAGLRLCRGEYIASLDSDDIWEPGFLSAGISRLHQHNINLVFMNWWASNDQNGLNSFALLSTSKRYFTKAVDNWWLLTPAQTRRMMLETCPAPSSAFILRRSAMQGEWNEKMRIADDWCMLLDVVLHQPTAAAFTLTPHWLKRIHGQNIYDGRDYQEVSQELSFHDEPLILQRHHHQLNRGEVALFKQRQAGHFLNYAYKSYKDQKRGALLRNLSQAWWCSPLWTCQRVAQECYSYIKRYSPGA